MSSSHFAPDRFATHAPSNDDPEGGGTSYHVCPSQSPADILIDGLIAYTFGPRASECYFGHLFKGQIRRSLLRWDVPGWPGACFTTQAVLNGTVDPPTHHDHQSPARLLDYDVRNLQGTVVPQALWSPQGPSATKKPANHDAMRDRIGFSSERKRAHRLEDQAHSTCVSR
ncbi:hypothetical protein BC826DRAFT_1106348 [Russula brevipes]|nr:hypothetical protein BC826DRAFT_1106348 [Russula brevipes]